MLLQSCSFNDMYVYAVQKEHNNLFFIFYCLQKEL